MQGATLLMMWNLFAFGDTFFKPLLGTAMGTPVAVIWAMLYFWWHIKHILIPKHGRKMLLMLQVVDTIYRNALVGGEDGYSKEKWDSFIDDTDKFGIFKWNVEDLSRSVELLDLASTIEAENVVCIQNTPEATQPLPVHMPKFSTPTLDFERYYL